MKTIQRIINAVFGLYTIKSPWSNHHPTTVGEAEVIRERAAIIQARVIFHHYRDAFVFERSIFRFLDVTFPREQTVADILKTTRMTDPDIEDLFIYMRTNTEFLVPVDKLSELDPLQDHGFTVLKD
jgi:hypothetical protein